MGIDLARVTAKLEQCFERHDLEAAEQLLLYWRAEAEAIGDTCGMTQVDNELLGLYRRTNRRDKGLAVAERLLPMLSDDNVGDATIRLNIATNYCHFGLPERAMPLYEQVERVYLAHLAADDYRLAGLYNNMAAMANARRDYAEAERLYTRALDIIRSIRPVMPEVAVTLVNLAVSKYMQYPLDPQVDVLMQEAYDTLQLPQIPRDGNYAFVLSKVIPVYRHLGYTHLLHTLQQWLEDWDSRH